MGGCVVSCMSSVNSSKQVENKYIRAVHKMPNISVQQNDEKNQPTESRIYRSPSSNDLTNADAMKLYYGGEFGTVPRTVQTVVLKYPQRKAMVYRQWDHIEKTEIDDNGKKKPWELIHLRDAQHFTYKEMWDRMMAFGNGLKKLGFKNGDYVGIYEETRWEWLVSMYGAWSQGMAGVTVYSNLGEDALQYAINESALPVIVCNAKNVKTLVRICKAAQVQLPKIIYIDPLPSDVDVTGLDAHSWTSVLELGSGIPAPELPSNPDSLAIIMYTSGTTGDPKGVMITHGNLFSAIKTTEIRLGEGLGVSQEGDTFVCYLPLAHIYESVCEGMFLMRGVTLCYGHPRTLTDLAARPRGDFSEYKPVFVAGVPRVWDTIKKAILAKLPPEGSLKRRVFDRAYEERKVALQKGFETPYWNEKVFGAARLLLGGKCRCLVSAAAPLSAATYEFLGIVFGCAIMQGYGLTETCCGTLQRYYEVVPDGCGGPLPGCEIKLRDFEDWKHSNNPPQGEVCMRGPGITKGYFKQPQKTAEAYTHDGWFCTGDVAEVQPNGAFKIIGRTKALVKTSFGEYIALEALEAVYVQNDLTLPNGVCVLANSHKAYICALVLTDEKRGMKFATENKLTGTWPDILKDPVFHEKAALSLAETAKAAGKKAFETVKYVRVLNDEWTPENGVMTAMKLKRRVVDKRYANLISELFSA